MTAYRLTAHRSRTDGYRLQVVIPAALSRALPEGHLLFEASFVDEGILLKYIGPKVAEGMQRQTEPTPEWAK